MPKARTYSIKTVDLAQIDERSFDSSSESSISFDEGDSAQSGADIEEFEDDQKVYSEKLKTSE